MIEPGGPVIGVIVKTSDLMEAVWFIDENGKGLVARQIQETMHERLRVFMTVLKDEHPMVYEAAKDTWVQLTQGTFVI